MILNSLQPFSFKSKTNSWVAKKQKPFFLIRHVETVEENRLSCTVRHLSAFGKKQ